MKVRLSHVLLVTVAAVTPGLSQSVIQTVLGSTPDGAPALTATLSTPVAVVVDSAGNVYTSLQGTHQIIRIDTSGIASIYAGNGTAGFSGDGGSARSAMLNTPAGLALDSAGNLYIADSKNSRIRRVATDGTISTVVGSGKVGNTGDGGLAKSASLKTPQALAFDINGNLLIADTGNSEIRIVTADGHIARFAGTGTYGQGGDAAPATSAYLYYPAGIAVDRSNNVYISDTYNNVIRVVSTDGNINLLAGSYSNNGYYGDNGDSASAYLRYPTSMVVDSAGNVYFVDQGNDRVRAIAPSGIITTVAGSGTRAASGDGGPGRWANLNVQGITLDAQHNMYIADGANNRVRKITASNGIINTIGGNGLASYSLKSVLVSGDTVYFSDTDNHRVRWLNLTTQEAGLLAGNGGAGYSGDDNTKSATEATLNAPRGLALDSAGRFYIADSGNNRVRRVNTDGTITTVAGTGTADSTGDGGTATGAAINEPTDVAVDGSGNLYIVEHSGHRVRKVNSGGIISTVAGTGTAAAGTNAVLGTDQPLSSPSSIVLDASGALLISDTNNHRVLRLSQDDTVQALTAANYGAFTGDGGPAISARLNNPMGVSTDAAGNIYVADSGNSAIRQIGTDGIITTVAGLPPSSRGAGTGGYNGDGSPATAYQVNQPYAITAGSNCTMLIADTGNRRLRRLWLGTDYTIATSPAGLQVLVDGQQISTPVTLNWLAGSSHTVAAPASQSGSTGTQYVSSSSTQTITVPCGLPRSTVAVSFSARYLLTVTVDPGGAVSTSSGYQNAGTALTLTATANTGYTFGGWSGDCNGLGTCQLTMNGPKTVRAIFHAIGVRPVISNGGVISAGGFGAQKSISSGSWIEIYGTNLASYTRSWVASDFFGDAAPTSLSGVSVTVAGKPAFVAYISPGQINAQAPDGIGTGAVPVVVTNTGVSSDPVSVTAASATPGLDAFANGYVAAYSGFTIVGSPGYTAVKPGDVITLYGIGFGPVTPSFAAGQVATALNALTATLEIKIGGTAAAVSYKGLNPGLVGLYQFNLTVPDVPDGNQPVTASVGGALTGQSLLLTVKR